MSAKAARSPLTLAALAAAVLAGCGAEKQPPRIVAPPPPGLAAEPRWLTFTCVEPGCETTETATIRVVGVRDIAIKRIVLSDRERDDVTFEPSREPPFVLEAGSDFDLAVTYRPTGDPRLGDVAVEIAYTDASASESEDRVEPGTLELPVVRRLVGEPRLEVSPEALVFGGVVPTSSRTLPLTVRNAGFGNVGLILGAIDSTHEDVLSVSNLPPTALLPGESWDLQVTYRPTAEAFMEGFLTVRAAGSTDLPAVVPILGTSIPGPALVVSPTEGIDFGEVPVGTSGQAALTLKNRGTDTLVVTSVEVGRGGALSGLEVTLPGRVGTSSVTLRPLASADIGLRLSGQTPGELNTVLRMTTTDPRQPERRVPLTGLVTKPEISVSAGAIDFGAVPRGWSVVRRVEISNAGYGDLVIGGLNMVLGSSELFSLRSIPALPARLRHAQRLALEVEFRSEAEASFAAVLSVESNDVETPSVEVNLAAAGASCERGCPIANGTPSCDSGTCAVGSCNAGFFDVDRSATNGCECRDPGNDPGGFCADSHWMGGLGEGDRANFSGMLPAEGDTDVLRFYANDDNGFFDEDFDVNVRLESPDPSVRFCIYRHNTSGHLTECFFENESCPGDRSFRRGGSLGPDDSADFIIRVERVPGAAPSCAPYTVFVRNG